MRATAVVRTRLAAALEDEVPNLETVSSGPAAAGTCDMDLNAGGLSEVTEEQIAQSSWWIGGGGLGLPRTASRLSARGGEKCAERTQFL